MAHHPRRRKSARSVGATKSVLTEAPVVVGGGGVVGVGGGSGGGGGGGGGGDSAAALCCLPAPVGPALLAVNGAWAWVVVRTWEAMVWPCAGGGVLLLLLLPPPLLLLRVHAAVMRAGPLTSLQHGRT